MKCVAAVLFLSLQLAGSASAVHETNRVEAENVLEQRQRNLRKKPPMNEKDKSLLKRLLEEKKLTRVDLSEDQYSHDANDPLYEAMRKSGVKKIDDAQEKRRNFQEKRKNAQEKRRGLQYYYNNFNYNYYDDYIDDYNGVYGAYAGGYGNNYYYYNNYDASSNNGMSNNNNNQQIMNTIYSAPQPKAEIPDKVSMVLEAFQDSRRVGDPVKLAPDSSYLNAGTTYLYDNEPLFNVVFDTPPGGSRGAYLVNERDRIAVVSGTCVRTDPKENYVGRTYCQFDYRFLDHRGNVEASIVAEGPVTKGDINTLSITGGSGIFGRVVGTVVLEPGNLRSGNPPFFIPNNRLDVPSSYMAKMFLFMDSVDLEMVE